MALTVKITDTKDSHTGYLSIDSQHSFVIDGRRWLSVEHYLLGKRFEGTSLEEKIRRSKTVQLAKMIAVPKRSTLLSEDGSITKIFEYENDAKPVPMDQVRNAYLKEALVEKFKQNPIIKQKLIDTKGTIIIDQKDPYHSHLLNEIRDELIDRKETKNDVISERGCFVDIRSDVLDQDLINTIYKTASIIKKIELLKDYYPGMFEDALYNAGFGNAHFQGLSTWIKKMSDNWSEVMRICPHYYNLYKQVMNWLVNKKLDGYDNAKYIETSLLLSSFIKWTILDHAKGSVVLGNLYSLRPHQIIIQPKVRSYRSLNNVVVHHPKKKEDIENKLSNETYGMFSLITDHSTLIFKTQDIDVYRPNIISIGGSITSPMTAEFPISDKSKVVEIIYTSLPSYALKRDFICQRWIRDKLEMLYDMKGLIHSSKPYATLLKLLGLKGTSKTLTFPQYITDSINEIGISQKFCNRICRHLIPNKNKVLKLVKGGDNKFKSSATSNNQRSFEDMLVYVSKSLRWQVIEKKTLDLENVINAMENIRKTLSLEDKEMASDLPLMIILPPYIRDKAKRYIVKDTNTDPLRVARQFLIEGCKNSSVMYSIMERCSLIKNPDITTVESTISSPIDTSPNDHKSFEIAKTLNTLKSDMTNRDESITLAEVDTHLNEKPKEDIETLLQTPSIINIDGNIDTIESSIPLSKGLRYLCVVTNAATISIPKTTPSEKITLKVYQKYKYASVYGPNSGKPYVTGSIITSVPPGASEKDTGHIRVITLIAEHLSGRPKKKVDTKDARKLWFEKCMKKVLDVVKDEDSITFFSDSLTEDHRNILSLLSSNKKVTIYIIHPPHKTSSEGQNSTSAEGSREIIEKPQSEKINYIGKVVSVPLIEILSPLPSIQRDTNDTSVQKRVIKLVGKK